MTGASAVGEADDRAGVPAGPGVPAIAVDGLVIRYRERTVVAGISFAVRAGELVALLGPNGAGKTSTVEAIEGLRRPSRGIVRVLGRDPATAGPAHRAAVGVMLQEGGLEPRATPRDLIGLETAIRGLPAGAAASALTAADLDALADRRVRRLSGGERQRLALALALVGDPSVLVLDEPTAGMDPAAKRATRERIAGRRDAGAAILLTTHDLGDVERLADRVVVLDRGRIVAAGSVAEIAGGRQTISVHFTGEPTPGFPAELSAWAADRGLALVDVRRDAATLEARYLVLTADGDVEHVS